MRFKRFIATLLMGLTVVVAFAETTYKVISSLPLNVREAPSSDSNVLGTFDSGSVIEVVSSKKGWAKVKYNGGYGFVQLQYIERMSSENTKNDGMISQAAPAEETQGAQNRISQENETSDFESERKSGTFEIFYSASSFDDVKLSGSYGISWTSLGWEMAPRVYAGVHLSPFSFNYGLSDFNYAEIKLGPAIGYYFTPKSFISAPLVIVCDVYTGENDKIKTAWGMALEPAVYIGNKAGVFIGPQFSLGFSDGSKIACGFRAGIYF